MISERSFEAGFCELFMLAFSEASGFACGPTDRTQGRERPANGRSKPPPAPASPTAIVWGTIPLGPFGLSVG